MIKKYFMFAMFFSFLGCASDSDDSSGISYGTFIYQGQTYKSVQIGDQTWMAENLNYNASGSKCYDNNPANCAIYGRLYNWETALTACPEGWHLPSSGEWVAFMRNVKGNVGILPSFIAGGKLKAKTGWNNNGNGTDDYGFSALPSGIGSPNGFFGIGDSGYWWTSSKISDGISYQEILAGGDAIWTYDIPEAETALLSVRCLKN